MVETASTQDTRMQAIVRRRVRTSRRARAPRRSSGRSSRTTRCSSASTRCPSNPVDWHSHARVAVPGADAGRAAAAEGRSSSASTMPGTVADVGKAVTRFRPGDEVFGCRNGAFAEYVRAREERAIVDEAGERDLRGCGRGGRRRTHRAPGPPRQGTAPGRAERARQRRLRRRGDVRGADREGARGRRDGGLQHAERRHRSARSAPTTSSTTRARTSRSGERRYDLMLDIAGGRPWSELHARARAEGDRRPGRRPEAQPLHRASRSGASSRREWPRPSGAGT